MSGSRITAPRTAAPRTAAPRNSGPRTAGSSTTVPEHVMPSATWGAPADFQTFLPPNRTQEVVETKCNGTIGNVLLLCLAISMLIIGNYFSQNCYDPL